MFTVWIVVYAVLVSSSRGLMVMPILARSAWMIGVMSTCGGVLRFTNRRPLQTLASHIPSGPPYFDCFSSACAFARSPVCPALAYGS